MIELNNKFAIGCLVQWYEIEIIGEYIESLKQSLVDIENKENVKVDFLLTTNQDLEKNDETITISEIEDRFVNMLDGFNYKITDRLVTISDYRRKFNTYYCDQVDVLMWGETDSLIPSQTFQILDNLHTQVKENSPKYVAFFGTCKMWDESWRAVEHTKFTDNPFIENDYDNWWSLKYTMSIDEMNKINNEVEELDVQLLNKHKFNGCGLVISSDIIKSGVNIPQSAFFVHEDTAFMFMLQKILGNAPQFVIKNILLVHNRNHPKKRMYVSGEGINGTMNEKRRSNDWYVKANKMSEQNVYNLFNQSKVYTWGDVFDE